MKTLKYVALFTLLFFKINYCESQNFLNGDFEINTAGIDQINLSNAGFNSFMTNCNGFGTSGNLDIITSAVYGGGPQNGNWFVALTGGGTDLLSLGLTAPLVSGNSYTISFYDKAWFNFISLPIDIGVSNTNNNFGSLVYSTTSSAVNSIWTQRVFTFVAPINAQFLTVRQQGVLSNWVQVDHFAFSGSPIVVSLGNDTAICEGSCTNISATVSGGVAPYTYSWTPNIGSGAGPYTVCPVSTTTYTLQVTDSAGSVASASVTVNVNSLPTAVLDPNGTITICNTNGIMLNANSGDYNYVWYHDGVVFQSGSMSNYFADSPGVYQVQVSDNASGCSSLSQTATIVLGGGPVVSIATAGGCGGILFTGSSITLSASATNAVSYSWSNGQTTASVQVTQPGTYCVTAYDASGCPSDVPSCTVVNTADISCGHNMQKVLLCHVPPGNPGNPQTLCIAPSAVPAHLANHPGDCLGSCNLYYPRLASDEIILIDEFYAETYPNPFNGTFSLHFYNSSEDDIIILTIYDILGRTVETYKDVNESTTIGSNLKKGIYFVEVRLGSTIQRTRIAKE